MTNEHTPGPWYLTAAPHSKGYEPDYWLSTSTPIKEDGAFLDLWTNGTNGEANARLIAAAPELLEALEAALYDPESLMHTTSRAKGQAAVDKAKGQEVR